MFAVIKNRHDGSRTLGFVDDHVLWYLQDNGYGRDGQKALQSLYAMVQKEWPESRTPPVPVRDVSQGFLLNRQGDLDDDAVLAIRNALVRVGDTVVIRNTEPGLTMPWEHDVPSDLKGDARFLWMHQAYNMRFANDEFDPCFGLDSELLNLLSSAKHRDLYSNWIVHVRNFFHERF